MFLTVFLRSSHILTDLLLFDSETRGEFSPVRCVWTKAWISVTVVGDLSRSLLEVYTEEPQTHAVLLPDDS